MCFSVVEKLENKSQIHIISLCFFHCFQYYELLSFSSALYIHIPISYLLHKNLYPFHTQIITLLCTTINISLFILVIKYLNELAT